jgi:ABC-type branched-subunit amino acid transport system ATPase component
MKVLDCLPIMADVMEGAAPLLRVAGLSHAFGGQKVLKDVAVELRPGEVVLLRGANGSGKTTLLNILTGNLVPDRGAIELNTGKNTVRFEFPLGFGVRGFSPEGLARLGLGRTWQDVRLFDTQSLANNIAVATPRQLGENPLWAVLRRGGVMRQERRVQEVARLRLADLGLGDRAGSSADRVSLGQSKRVAIARAVQAGVRVLCLDEPLAGLDAGGIEEVMGLLRELVVRERLTLVIVEHVFNIPRVLDLATTVWTLADGEISIESAQSVRSLLGVGKSGGIDGWLRDLEGEMVVQDLSGGAMLKVIRVPGVEIGEVILAVEDLVVCRGKRLVVDGLSFELRRGELGLLLAPNGWGKTTLLEALMGLIPVDRGKIWLNGQLVSNLPTWKRSISGMSMLQSRDNIFSSLTVREMLRIAKIQETKSELQHLMGRKMSDLSGGERQQLLLACSLGKSDKSIRLLDEPFSALDVSTIRRWQQCLLEDLSKLSLMIAVPLGN